MLNSWSADLGRDRSSGWWALYTRHQHEKIVAEMLSAKGFEVFLPLYESTRHWKDRCKVISLPLFPCYVFIRGELDRQLQAVTTPGVHMVLGSGDGIALIPNGDIEAIRKIVQEPSRVEPHLFLTCGERVRVIRGCLQGIEGILLRKKNLSRLIVSVDMLAQAMVVEIDASDVERIGQQASAEPWMARQSAKAGSSQRTSPAV